MAEDKGNRQEYIKKGEGGRKQCGRRGINIVKGEETRGERRSRGPEMRRECWENRDRKEGDKEGKRRKKGVGEGGKD